MKIKRKNSFSRSMWSFHVFSKNIWNHVPRQNALFWGFFSYAFFETFENLKIKKKFFFEKNFKISKIMILGFQDHFSEGITPKIHLEKKLGSNTLRKKEKKGPKNYRKIFRKLSTQNCGSSHVPKNLVPRSQKPTI